MSLVHLSVLGGIFTVHQHHGCSNEGSIFILVIGRLIRSLTSQIFFCILLLPVKGLLLSLCLHVDRHNRHTRQQ